MSSSDLVSMASDPDIQDAVFEAVDAAVEAEPRKKRESLDAYHERVLAPAAAAAVPDVPRLVREVLALIRYLFPYGRPPIAHLKALVRLLKNEEPRKWADLVLDYGAGFRRSVKVFPEGSEWDDRWFGCHRELIDTATRNVEKLWHILKQRAFPQGTFDRFDMPTGEREARDTARTDAVIVVQHFLEVVPTARGYRLSNFDHSRGNLWAWLQRAVAGQKLRLRSPWNLGNARASNAEDDRPFDEGSDERAWHNDFHGNPFRDSYLFEHYRSEGLIDIGDVAYFECDDGHSGPYQPTCTDPDCDRGLPDDPKGYRTAGFRIVMRENYLVNPRFCTRMPFYHCTAPECDGYFIHETAECPLCGRPFLRQNVCQLWVLALGEDTIQAVDLDHQIGPDDSDALRLPKSVREGLEAKVKGELEKDENAAPLRAALAGLEPDERAALDLRFVPGPQEKGDTLKVDTLRQIADKLGLATTSEAKKLVKRAVAKLERFVLPVVVREALEALASGGTSRAGARLPALLARLEPAERAAFELRFLPGPGKEVATYPRVMKELGLAGMSEARKLVKRAVAKLEAFLEEENAGTSDPHDTDFDEKE